MPANDSMPHRGASAVRGLHRFTPYIASDGSTTTTTTTLKANASCPNLSIQAPPTLLVSSPEDSTLDSPTGTSSTATLVNSSFDCDKSEIDSPCSLLFPDCGSKFADGSIKCQQRQEFHQKKVDYVSELIEHACQTLNEVWPTPGVPAVFRYRHGANFGYSLQTAEAPLEEFQPRNYETDLIPLQKFVKEILRRSRSTCSTLQTALCYLEAIRHKIPAIQQAEKDGKGVRGDQQNNEGRVELDCTCQACDLPDETFCDVCIYTNDPIRLKKLPSPPPTPLPQLPSALLCPRRAFMGALVLSAKFVQDKSYSNRAWAKLCGLPAREVSRCERALGDALEWRLWVGRDKAFALSGLELKLGRAPTMMQALPAVDERDRKDSLYDAIPSTPLARAKTWPLLDPTADPTATLLITPEESFSSSPTPSLCYSTSSSSTCPSGALSPTYLSPFLPSFVPNDPCSGSNSNKNALRQLRLQNFLKQTVFDTPPSYPSCGNAIAEQDDFGIRVGYNEIQVV